MKQGKKPKDGAARMVGGSYDAGGTGPGGPKPRMKRKEYEAEIAKLQGELVKLQYWVRHSGTKVCVVFEGRDAAGKGGVIKRITERTSPRVYRVVALPAPNDREKSQMYMQRYVSHFPSAGEIILFDRSWYNRAGVERVMRFTPKAEIKRFLKMTPAFEQSMLDAGIILIKYWLEVSAENQTARFKKRLTDPRRTWKLSPMDLESHKRWDDYSLARDEMFEATDTESAPWYVVDSNDKRRARLNCISHLLSTIPYEDLPRPEVIIPPRKHKKSRTGASHVFRYVPEVY